MSEGVTRTVEDSLLLYTVTERGITGGKVMSHSGARSARVALLHITITCKGYNPRSCSRLQTRSRLGIRYTITITGR